MTFHPRIPQGASVAIALLPIALPVAYVLYTKRQVSRHTTSLGGIRALQPAAASSTPLPLAEPASLPADVRSDGSQWVLAYERVVSHPVPVSSLHVSQIATVDDVDAPDTARDVTTSGDATDQPSPLMKQWLRATHGAFSWTPQAFVIRACIGDAHMKHTFDADWIQRLSFAKNDIVNGVYRVSHIDSPQPGGLSERTELALEAPPSYRGPPARGLILSAVEPAKRADGTDSSDAVVFVNETWMWRRADDKPTLLESAVGKWVHSLLAGWLVMKGIKAVTVKTGGITVDTRKT